MTTETLAVVAIAILHQQGKFLMQLRDDIPGIRYPGQWGLFGGHLEGDETPEAGLQRELQEEIGHVPPRLTLFGCYPDPGVIRHVFGGELIVGLGDLVLGEGWDMDLLTPEEIRRGDRYSHRAQQVRPLGAPHQQVLLEFMAQMG